MTVQINEHLAPGGLPPHRKQFWRYLERRLSEGVAAHRQNRTPPRAKSWKHWAGRQIIKLAEQREEQLRGPQTHLGLKYMRDLAGF